MAIDMSKNLTASIAAKIITKHLKPKKKMDFPDLPEYEKLILKAECLELRASKLLKYADKCRNEACNILIKENNE